MHIVFFVRLLVPRMNKDVRMSDLFLPSRSQRNRAALGWGLLILLLLQGPLLRLVLCFEDNGRIVVETPHQRSTHTTLPSHSPCLDQPLLNAGRMESSSLALVSSHASAYILLAFPDMRPPCNANMLAANFLALLSATPPPLRHTTLLLI